MDFIGPLPETKKGNRHILNVVDKLSKILRAVPLADNYDAIIVAKKSWKMSILVMVYPKRSYPIATQYS